MLNPFRLFFDLIRQIYAYREYLKQSVLRDLRTKYKRSILGYLWTMLHPLGMMAILAIVFSHVMRIGMKDYAVFLFPGMLVWSYFNSTSMMSLNSIRSNARLFGQIPLPKYIFIISLTCSNLVNLCLAIVPLLLIMLALGHPISFTVLLFPVVLLPVIFVVIGVSLVLATSNVFFDDTLHLSEVAMQGLYFLSPVLYYRDLLPERIVKFLVFNPLFCQIEFFRGLFYQGTLPDPKTFGLNALGAFAILIFGLLVFKRSEDKFLYFV